MQNSKSQFKIKNLLIVLGLAFAVYLFVRFFIEFPIDCFPTIGPEPIEERIFKVLFRTKCVTF